jgi:metal-sulfur cluster biosynthetic enzyme
MLSEQQIIDALMTVYDPEFPLIDIWTMGLIYNIEILEDLYIVNITMTLTTPACPAADFITESVKNVIEDRYSDYDCAIMMTFEPVWTIEMIKDEDFRKLFS